MDALTILRIISSFYIFYSTLTLVHGDGAEDQLPIWAEKHQHTPQQATLQTGVPAKSLTSSQTVGHYGPILLQDTDLTEHLATFNRERIPERVVHARGAGAFGYFEVTHDITHWTKARLFSRIGKKTPVLVRFSTTVPETGSSDGLRDGRGFAIKFYTEDGNYDIAGINLPIFPIREPFLFPSLIRSRKRNPVTHLPDPNSFWDFNSLRPETTFHTLLLFSDLGIPSGFRYMDGFGVHAFKFVNGDDEPTYVKIHFISNQGVRGLDASTAERISGQDPDFALRDLYNEIDRKEFPSWDVAIQVMSYEEAENLKFNPFDTTKRWPVEDFPLFPVGKLTLNRNPTNYFTQIEQAAFSPGNFVPGIEPSPDRILQGRLFAYPDTHRYRLGVNFNQIPVNRPSPKVEVVTYQRDGDMRTNDNQDGMPNYFPNSFNGPCVFPRNNSKYFVPSRDVVRVDIGDDDNYSQADLYWKNELSPAQRERVVLNIGNDIKKTTKKIQDQVLSKMFDPINSEISFMLRTVLKKGIRNDKN